MDSSVAEEFRCHAQLMVRVDGGVEFVRCPMSSFDHEQSDNWNYPFIPAESLPADPA